MTTTIKKSFKKRTQKHKKVRMSKKKRISVRRSTKRKNKNKRRGGTTKRGREENEDDNKDKKKRILEIEKELKDFSLTENGQDNDEQHALQNELDLLTYELKMHENESEPKTVTEEDETKEDETKEDEIDKMNNEYVEKSKLEFSRIEEKLKALFEKFEETELDKLAETELNNQINILQKQLQEAYTEVLRAHNLKNGVHSQVY